MFLGDMHNLVYQMILLASIQGLVALGRLEVTVRQNKLRGTIQHKSLEEESMIQHRDLWEGDMDLGFLVGKDQEGLDSSHGSHRNDAASTAAPILAAAWDRVVPVGGSRDPHDQQSHNDSFAYHGSGFKPRVVGGQDSELQSFAMHLKWDDTIQEWKFAGCGGTLISECHILTAAHCVTFPRKHTTEAIYINAWRPFHNNSDGIVTKPYHLSRILPEKTVVHEGFQNQNNFNDIAILTLETCTSDFDVMRVASPAVEQDVAIQNGVTTRVAGFGQISPVNAATPDVLQSVEVTYIEGTDCEHQYYPLQIQPDMYCAGFATGGKDSCNGDSGGPSYVVDPVTQQTIQIGIVSWGISCAKEGKIHLIPRLHFFCERKFFLTLILPPSKATLGSMFPRLTTTIGSSGLCAVTTLPKIWIFVSNTRQMRLSIEPLRAECKASNAGLKVV
jgi:trypsin